MCYIRKQAAAAAVAAVIAAQTYPNAHLSRDDGVNNSPSVADHENKLRIWEKLLQVNSGSQGEWILIAQSFGRLSVFCYDLQYEGRDSRIQYFRCDSCLFKSPGFKWCPHPLLPKSQHAGHDPGLLPAPYVRMSIQQNS
jgi:hypothetical protein